MKGLQLLFSIYFFGKKKELSPLRSFLLKEKNQKFKAYTPAATNSRRGAEISVTRFAQTAEISFRSAWNLLYAASVRPVLMANSPWIMDNFPLVRRGGPACPPL